MSGVPGSAGPAVQSPGRSAGASYDEVPYQSHAIPNTSPDSLATMGTLFGMNPAPVETCRVLELGCAGGGNLVAMALPLPNARFVGIDASRRQIETGRKLAREVGVGNVELETADLLRLPNDLGEFDYIVCHGVYSWVPPPVQEEIFAIFARHLAPHGVAYLSYNTYPGGHVRAMAREMMRFHVRHLADPAKSTAQARSLLPFLRRFVRDRRGVYEKILDDLIEQLLEEPDWYVFHEYLEEHNAPVYFSDLIARAAGEGLQYLAPANFVAWEHNLPAELEEVFGRLSNRIVREQYLDFLLCRTFRRTLFCRAGVPLAREPRPEALEGLQAIGRARPVRPNPDIRSNVEEEFRSLADDCLSSDRPLVKAALLVLAEMLPRSASVATLWPLLAERLSGEADATAGPAELSRTLLTCHLSGAVALRTWTPPLVLSPGDRPAASPLARLQAARNEPVVNLRHEGGDLSDLDRAVVQLLDGTRDRGALREGLASAVADGRLQIEDASGARMDDRQRVAEVIAASLEGSLGRLAAACLLTS